MVVDRLTSIGGRPSHGMDPTTSDRRLQRCCIKAGIERTLRGTAAEAATVDRRIVAVRPDSAVGTGLPSTPSALAAAFVNTQVRQESLHAVALWQSASYDRSSNLFRSLSSISYTWLEIPSRWPPSMDTYRNPFNPGAGVRQNWPVAPMYWGRQSRPWSARNGGGMPSR